MSSNAPMIPFEPFEIVYLDPMWQYRVRSRKGLSGSAENHYPTMGLPEMKTLPIPDLLAKNSAVFMWATYPNLREAFELGDAYGLTYKTVAFTWVKLNKLYAQSFARYMKKHPGDIDGALDWIDQHAYFMGNGYYTRANPEICLLFTKGKPLPRVSRAVRNLIIRPIGKHSEKPEIAARRIEQLFGAETRKIEVFARRYRRGWSSIGLDLDGLDVRESIPLITAGDEFARTTAVGSGIPLTYRAELAS